MSVCYRLGHSLSLHYEFHLHYDELLKDEFSFFMSIVNSDVYFFGFCVGSFYKTTKDGDKSQIYRFVGRDIFLCFNQLS